ncbi:MAG: stage II sporulation protein M [Ginsengibacter sp.]
MYFYVMREARFIKKNVEKWNTYQHTETNDPDETAERFITLLDDLSYAKTFYPKSKVTAWINGIAASTYQTIYQNKKEKFSRITNFWKYELPLLIKQYHKILLFTFMLFLFFVLIAVTSCILDRNYAESFFDNNVQRGYYDDTVERIQTGDPFGVYKDDNPFSMFIRIAYNNISVAFKAVISGIFFGIGTLILMWQNGLMLGCFQYIFFEQGVGWQSVLVIWIHGTLEISAIVIASCAGLILGSGFLFPGTFTRTHSFLVAAKNAMKICICLIPIFIVAAFFESYITHLMSNAFDKDTTNIGLPLPVSILILSGSLAFIIWYFIIYPSKVYKSGYRMINGTVVNHLINK